MNKELDIFYFSSTHWDREWYQDFQGYRYRLVNMVNNLIKLFEADPDYRTFHFDGQTIVLEDYLEVSPENREKLQQLIGNRRILIGPWYVMPDEFLLSGESLIRNLMIGHKIASDWGVEPWKYGYVCDIFGHIAQMPQIFNGFDIKYTIASRGLTENAPTYFRWQSPNGSECLNFKLQPEAGYSTVKVGVYMNVDDPSVNNPDTERRIKNLVDSEIERSKLPIVVLMDGGDHTEASLNTTDYIKMIERLYPNARVHHIDLCEQGRLLEKYRGSLPVIKGELNHTAIKRHIHLHLITNTLSSYYTIKKENDECQNLLEKRMEPLLVMAKLGGIDLNRSFINIAYKSLIQNHPHDSICGCSVDRVHKDMEYRFSQVKEICKAVTDDYIVKDRRDYVYPDKNGEYILTLYNTLPFALDKTVTVDLGFHPEYPMQYSEPFDYENINSFKIYDCDDNEIPYQIVEIKRDRIERVFNAKCEQRDIHTVTFRASVPACGKAEYKIIPQETPVRYLEKMKSGFDYAENDFIRLSILQNGAIEITDKKTGRIYTNLCNLVDDGEIGDGWYHVNPVGDRSVFSGGNRCIIEKTEDGPSRCVFKTIRNIEVPKEMIETKAGRKRSKETVALKVIMYVGLSAENRYADIKMSYENLAKDHRLRLVIPTGVKGDTYFAGQAFYCCERKIGIDYTTQNWREIDPYEKATNGIFGKRDADGCGIGFVSSKGLHECAAYKDEDNTLCVTLSRSFSKTVMTNGETAGQLNKKLEYEFALIPLDKEVTYSALLKVQDTIACNVMTNFVPAAANEATPPVSYMSVDGENVAASMIKQAENQKDAIVVRLFNASDKESCGRVKLLYDIRKAELTNLNEEVISQIPFEKRSVTVSLKPWEIVTLMIS